VPDLPKVQVEHIPANPLAGLRDDGRRVAHKQRPLKQKEEIPAPPSSVTVWVVRGLTLVQWTFPPGATVRVAGSNLMSSPSAGSAGLISTVASVGAPATTLMVPFMNG
jgi:hypothetical protein